MKVLIMGSGRTGSLLAQMLDQAGHEVSIIDWNADALTRLPDDFGGRTLLGNALDQDVLRLGGVETADVFVAATSGDNRNIVSGELAKFAFNVPRVVVRIKDPERAGYFARKGLQVDCRTSEGTSILIDLANRELLEQTA
ncbi:MAG: NAD-binding protein [Chloroflexota bacterium]